MTPAIEVRNVEKVFRQSTGLFSAPRMVRAVDGVSFAVPQGGCFGIVGESGCGKSTLARLILGLHPATGGDILVDGRALGDMKRRERIDLPNPHSAGVINTEALKPIPDPPMVNWPHFVMADTYES